MDVFKRKIKNGTASVKYADGEFRVRTLWKDGKGKF
jgi:hypothetical protein